MYKFKYCRYRSNNCTSIFSLSHSIIDATSRLSRNRDPVGNMLRICRDFVPRSTCLIVIPIVIQGEAAYNKVRSLTVVDLVGPEAAEYLPAIQMPKECLLYLAL